MFKKGRHGHKNNSYVIKQRNKIYMQQIFLLHWKIKKKLLVNYASGYTCEGFVHNKLLQLP